MKVKKTYIYANSQILAQHNGNHTAEKYFYLHDRLGSVRQVIDQNAWVVKYYTFDAFGKTLEEGGTLTNPFMFTGQWFDSEISQYYLRARQYDPVLFRFTSRDPVFGKFEEPLSLHKYLYCRNDPINWVDPSGKFSVGGLFELMVSESIADSLRIMDTEFNRKLFENVSGKIDAFSMMNLQRGVTMDLFIASWNTDLKGTIRNAGIAALGLYSENLSRAAGFFAGVYDDRNAIEKVLKGNEQLDDYIGFNIVDAISTTASESW
jgi:RHS repeat-associated protein